MKAPVDMTWTAEREVKTGELPKMIGPERLAVEVMADGFTLGYWVDTEWDGHGGRADRFIRAVNSHAELVAALREIVTWHRLAVEGKDRSINSALGYIDHMGMAASAALAKATA